MEKNYYDLNLEEIVKYLEKEKAKRVLIQLPDGLKPLAKQIVDFLEKKFSDVEFFIWGSTNFGACDLPIDAAKTLNIDVILHFGHNTFLKWD